MWPSDEAMILVTVTNRGLRMAMIDAPPLFIGRAADGAEIAINAALIPGRGSGTPARLDEGATVQFVFEGNEVLAPPHYGAEVTVLYVMLPDQFGKWFYGPFPGVRMRHGWLRRLCGRKPKFEHPMAGVTVTAH